MLMKANKKWTSQVGQQLSKKKEVQFHEKLMLKKANKKWTSQVGQLFSQTKEVQFHE